MRISSAQLWSRPAVVGLGAISGLFAAGALVLSTSEAMLRAQFVTAFDSYTAAAASGAQQTSQSAVAPVPFAAGEDFWLGGAHRNKSIANAVKPASWGGPVAVGDQITVSAAGGQRVYEIVAITELANEGVTHIAHGAPQSGLLLVTALRKDTSPAQHIRFVVEQTGAGIAQRSNTASTL